MRIFFDNIFLEVLTFLGLITYLLYYYLTSTFSFWKKKNVPYIEPEIFFGNMKDIVTFKKSQPEKFSEFYHYFKKMGLKFGGIFQMREPVLLVISPDLVKTMLVKDFPSFHDRGFVHDENFDPLSANLVFLDGQKWKYIRSKLTPTFSTGKLKNMVNFVRDAGDNLLKVLETASKESAILEMKEITAQYATDVVGSCAFGLQFNTLRDGVGSEFREMGKKAFHPSKVEKVLQIVRNSYPWIYKTFKLRLFSKEVTDFFTKLVMDTMQYRRENKINRQDFLNYLMQIKELKASHLQDAEGMKGVENYSTAVDENAIELTDGVVAAQAFIFFLAGYETSSGTMSFCFHELASHPEIQEKVHEEVVKVFDKYKVLNHDALQELTYLEQVIEETLRLYPPLPLLLRRCTKPYKIPDSDVILEPGNLVFFPTYSYQRDPEYYPDPDEFRPERFSPENREKLVPHTILPFGEGPRICIGMRFGMLQVKMAIALTLLNYKATKCEKTRPVEIDPRSFSLTTKEGIWLKIVKR